MTSAVNYKKGGLNFVLIAIVLVLVAIGYLTYLFVPIRIRAGEAMRVLDERSSEFTGQSSRMLVDRNVLKKLLNDMTNDLRTIGIDDPNAEFWIEVDNDNQVRFGVLYSDWLELPFTAPRERVHELEMLCTRPDYGTGWSCESRDLRTNGTATDDELVEPGT